MSLKDLTYKINELDIEGMTSTELKTFIIEYAEEVALKYNKDRTDRKLTFGKHKGYTVEELSLTVKGKDYLRWLLKQSWCTEDRFEYIYEDARKYKVI
jgi:hypothetical protein